MLSFIWILDIDRDSTIKMGTRKYIISLCCILTTVTIITSQLHNADAAATESKWIVIIIKLCFYLSLRCDLTLYMIVAGFVPNVQNKIDQVGKRRLVVYEDPESENQNPDESEKSGGEEGGSLLFDANFNSGGSVEDSKDKRLKCHACEAPHCEIVYTCSHAVMVSQIHKMDKRLLIHNLEGVIFSLF